MNLLSRLYSENAFIPTKNETAFAAVPLSYIFFEHRLKPDRWRFPKATYKERTFLSRTIFAVTIYCAFSFFAAFFFFLSSSKRSGIKASKTMMTAAAMAR